MGPLVNANGMHRVAFTGGSKESSSGGDQLAGKGNDAAIVIGDIVQTIAHSGE